MPVINVSERLLQPAGHHRIPRSHATWIAIEDPDNPDQPPNHYEVGHDFQHHFAAHMPMPGGAGGQATFVFACASNGTNGQTYVTPSVDAEVTVDAPMSVIAYYAPPGGLGPDGGPGWFVDAFSDAHNDFVDDYFVTVEGDAQATEDANVVGEVSTEGQTLRLDANASIASTGESFEQWVGTAATTGDVDVLAADSNGIAIATYHVTAPVPPSSVKVHAEEGVRILWGLIGGGDGVEWTPHGPKHVDPGWGTLAARILRAGAVARLGQSMAHADEIARLCVSEVHAAVRDLGVAAKESSSAVTHAANPMEPLTDRVAEY